MSSLDPERFDPLFLNIAQHTRGIDELLDVFLGFLARKTDFFNPPEGVKQLEATFLGAVRRQYEITQAARAKKAGAAAAGTKAPGKPAAATSGKPGATPATATATAAPAPPAAKAATPSAPAEEPVYELGEGGAFDISGAPSKAASSAKAAAPVASAPAAASALAATDAPAVSGGDGASKAAGEPETAAEGAAGRPIGNGGATDRYTWTQTLSDVTVVFHVPKEMRTRDLAVEIKTGKIRVGLKGKPPMLEGTLHKRVKADDSTWTLDEDATGKALTVFLAKENGMEWWSCVAEGEPTIDVTKIEPENSKLSDLDGETRKTVEKMMFDQRQKMAGLPSSEELQKQEMLKKFMAAHPEMDFSQAKFM